MGLALRIADRLADDRGGGGEQRDGGVGRGRGGVLCKGGDGEAEGGEGVEKETMHCESPLGWGVG